ncbi:ATP-binding cassette domain-containing protein [Kangiella japonica]|uniref:ATP-binding cassette domain-containing protein n=1 Tax=Kangiella japonica TaxID=647384 RepID=A0ABN0SV48_9GAMM
MTLPTDNSIIKVEGLTMAYDNFVVQRDLTFDIKPQDIFIIMGGSGCGKSTLLKHFVGLKEPAAGRVLFRGDEATSQQGSEFIDFWQTQDSKRQALMQRCGVLYQSGALWSSMTLAENIELPLGEFTDLSPSDTRHLASLKLALVGLSGFEDYYPSEISGGMRKRAGLARALALEPELLFLDEPSAGLDPISARMLDDLILQLRDNLGCTFVVVTHELASIFAIGNNSVFLDAESKTMLTTGNPNELVESCDNDTVRNFLTRGEGG